MTDPLLELVRNYQSSMRAYNASPDDLYDDEDPALPAFEANYHRLCTAPPDATTLEGAVEAVRLVLEEERDCGNQPDLTINVLRAALAFFDSGRVTG